MWCMKKILILVALLELVASLAMAAAIGEKTVLAQSHDESMVAVPAGNFMMGSSIGDADEQPEHQVYVETFLMDKYQVSVGHYARFLDATSREAPPDWTIMNRSQHQRRPIVN